MSWEDSPAAGPWWLRRALLGTLLFVGCDGAPGGSTRFIPPAVDLESFEPEVRRQIEEQQRSAEAVPSDPEAIGRLAMLLHAYGRLDAAEAAYRAANAVAPGDDRWPCGLAHVLVERGGAAEAKSVLEEALRRNPHSAPAALGLGDLALKDADATLAKSCFAKALDASPGSPHALVGLAQAALLEGNTAEAIGRCEEALRAAPRFGKALFVEASAARAAGDPQRANELLELHARSDKNFAPPDPILDALESLRCDSDSVLRRGNAAFQEGRFEDALQLFATALERNPRLAMAEYDLGLALQQLGRHAEAVERYERFLAAQPRSVDGLNNLGLALQALGRRDAALERFETALAVDPAYTTARLNMARALRASGRPDEAARHLIEALRREPRSERIFDELLRDAPEDALGASHRKLAAVLQREGAPEAAIAALRRGIRAAPSDWRTPVALAWILATTSDAGLRDPAEAVRLAEPPCRGEARDDATALDTLAAAYAAASRFDDAVRAAERAATAAASAQAGSAAPGRSVDGIRSRLELYRQGKAYREE
ncbi:MAG TPA: tetratricopeptide repeat protein [Planctomycetota bacterium]|nr:tetratricopeptide repeat protein [Planctomycetota bacterium]